MKISKSITFVLMLAVWFGAVPVARAGSTPPKTEAAKQTRALVERAATLIARKGKAAFADFSRKDGPWLTGDTYIFVLDMNGVELFSGGFPDQVGTDLSRLEDFKGKLIVAEQQKVIRSRRAGWVDYQWPKPGQTDPVQKWSYVKAVTVDGTPGYVGAGFYP
jgi:cytochrome c